jgi:riboflavin kinase/FMN adenylyltransferase
MQVHRQIEQLPLFRKAIVTIGTFDGVHQGHKKIIRQLTSLAKTEGGESVIVTFHPHPRQIVKGARPVALINTLEEKIELLSAEGVDHLVIVPFTEAFSQQSATTYVESFLLKNFQPHTLIIGYDHRFGQNRAGDFSLLESYAARGAFRLLEIPAEILLENTISSTRIREAVQNGQVRLASDLLGYPFRFEGTVTEGNRLGRTIGYPTANLLINDPEKLTPGNGVYAVQVYIPTQQADSAYAGMMNIGHRPTVNGTRRTIEVNIFDFKGDLYGENIRVETMDYIRGEQKFSSLEALKDQLSLDKLRAKELLSV